MGYRVLRKEVWSGGFLQSVNYYVQKRFLFFWFKVGFPSGRRDRKWSGGWSDIILQKVIPIFESQEEAEMYIDRFFINTFKMKHKGNSIIRVINYYNFEDLYVNTSKVVSYYADDKCYDGDKNLDELIRRIDQKS